MGQDWCAVERETFWFAAASQWVTSHGDSEGKRVCLFMDASTWKESCDLVLFKENDGYELQSKKILSTCI